MGKAGCLVIPKVLLLLPTPGIDAWSPDSPTLLMVLDGRTNILFKAIWLRRVQNVCVVGGGGIEVAHLAWC